MNPDLSHLPAGYHSVTPSLTAKDANAALAFYAAAFGAEEHFRLPDAKTGGVAHAEFAIGSSTMMISDEYPDYNCLAPEIGQGGTFMIYVPDVQAAFDQAVRAGATVLQEPADQFWGDRSARVSDPHGYRWTLAQRTRQVSSEEMSRLYAECQSAS